MTSGDYEYLGDGYYACQETEDRFGSVTPAPADVLDAYVVPLALERAALAGLPVPGWSLTNGAFQPPALLYGVNPFARTHLRVDAQADVADAARRMSRRGKFVICCQALPPDADVVAFEQVFDTCVDERYQGWARALFGLFRLPLARVRLIVTPEQDFLSAIERLPRAELSPASAQLFSTRLQAYQENRG